MWRDEKWWRCRRRGEVRRMLMERRRRCLRSGEVKRMLMGRSRRGKRRRGERRRSRWWLGHQLPGSDHGCKATGPLLVGSWWTCPRGAASC